MEDVGEVVGQAAGGDAGAWADLVERFAGLIWSVARSQGLSPADASDVSQTTWLRFAEHLDDLRDPAQAGAWLATTARREAIRVSRLGSRQVLVDPWDWLEHIDTGTAQLDDHVLAQERELIVQQAVAVLPQRCRRILEAVAADPPVGYSELSQRLGIPIGSIGPTRGRCLERLRRVIEDLEQDMVPSAAISGKTAR